MTRDDAIVQIETFKTRLRAQGVERPMAFYAIGDMYPPSMQWPRPDGLESRVTWDDGVWTASVWRRGEVDEAGVVRWQDFATLAECEAWLSE